MVYLPLREHGDTEFFPHGRIQYVESMGSIRSVWRLRHFILLKIRSDIRTQIFRSGIGERFFRSSSGYLRLILAPAALIATFIFVFSEFMKAMSRHFKQPYSLEENCPLPGGVGSREIVLEMFQSVSIDGGTGDELRSYAEIDCDRFLHTLNLVRPDAKRLLEIGASPYFSSILFKEFRSANLTFTNYFGLGPERGKNSIQYENHKGKKQEWQVEYASINIEETVLPAKDCSYDHVVFCEVLEHLTNDPLFAMTEINRVLEIGGSLVLSTPNVARLENAAALLSGANIYDPYSGYGPYGRHNREYTSQELNWLLLYTGFEVETFFTLDASPDNAALYFDVETLKLLVEFREQDLGHYMFVRAVKRRNVFSTLRRPMWLYRSFGEQSQLVDLSLLDDPAPPNSW